MQADVELRRLTAAIVSGEPATTSRLLAASPTLATACFRAGATRASAKAYYLERIARYINAGDTALHIAAACYETQLVRNLIKLNADVHRETGSVSNHSTPRPSAHLVLIPGIPLRKLRPFSRSLRRGQIQMPWTSLE